MDTKQINQFVKQIQQNDEDKKQLQANAKILQNQMNVIKQKRDRINHNSWILAIVIGLLIAYFVFMATH